VDKETTTNEPGGEQHLPPTQENPPIEAAASPTAESAPKKPGKRKLLLLVIILIVIAGLVVTFLLVHKKKPVSHPLSKISVRLEWVNNPEFTGMYIAQDKGFYRDAGLDVDLKEFEDSTDVNKEVAEGTVDFGVSTPLEIILARDKGEKNKAIAAIYQTSAYSIVTQKSAGIKSPADFKGKTLGSLGDNNEAKVTYGVLLANAGLSSSDAPIKGVDFDIAKVFNENQAATGDIYRTDQTYLLDQAHIPYDQIFPEQYGFAIYGDVLIASDSKISSNPTQTKAFVAATLKGWQYAIDHPAEALTILAKHDNVLYKDQAYVKFDLNGTLPLIKTTASEPLGSMQFVVWNRAYNGVKEAGILKTDLSASDFYTSEFVR